MDKSKKMCSRIDTHSHASRPSFDFLTSRSVQARGLYLCPLCVLTAQGVFSDKLADAANGPASAGC